MAPVATVLPSHNTGWDGINATIAEPLPVSRVRNPRFMTMPFDADATRVPGKPRGLQTSQAALLVLVILVIIWLPTLILRLGGGFQIVDYFGSFPDEYLQVKNPLSWSGLAENFVQNSLHNAFHFRPVWVAIMQFLLIVFHGDYGAQFFVKFLFSTATVFLAFDLVRRRTGSVYPALFCAVIIIVHPSPANLFLYTSEAITGFFIVLTLWWLAVPMGIWEQPATGLPLSTLRHAWGDAPLRPVAYLAFVPAVLAAIGIAGSKEYGFVITLAVAACLVFLLIFKFRRRVTAGIVAAASLLFTLFCVYRVHAVRDTLIKVVAPIPTGWDFWIEFDHRLHYGIQDLSPIQWNAKIGKEVAALTGLLLVGLLVKLLIRLWRRRLALADVLCSFLSLEALLLASVLATLVLSAIPSGYPPRMSPRYIVPAAPPFAMLLAIAWFEIWPKSTKLMLVFTGFLVLAAPYVTYKRDLEWALYNNAFATYVDTLKQHQQRGDKIVVAVDGEVGNSLINFFGEEGAALFKHGLRPVSRTATGLVGPARIAVASEAAPPKFLAPYDPAHVASGDDPAHVASGDDPTQRALGDTLLRRAVVEAVEVVKYNDYHGSGMDRVVFVWNRIGKLIGGRADPYYESATVGPSPGPRFYIYTLCLAGTGFTCGEDVRSGVRQVGDFCTVNRTDGAPFPIEDGPPRTMRIEERGGSGFTSRIAMPQPAVPPDQLQPRATEYVFTGHARVTEGTLRLTYLDTDGHAVPTDRLDIDSTTGNFEHTLVVPSGPQPAAVALFADPKHPVAATLDCPNPVIAIPVRVVRPPVVYGSFLP